MANFYTFIMEPLNIPKKYFSDNMHSVSEKTHSVD